MVVPEATFRMKVPARYVPFLSLCPSFHTGDMGGQCSGLNLCLIEYSSGYWEECGLWCQTDRSLNSRFPPKQTNSRFPLDSSEISAELLSFLE